MNINIIMYSSFLFFTSEFALMMIKRSRKKRTKTRADRKSLVLFWIVIPLSISSGFFLANYQDWGIINQWIASLGLFLYTAGIVIRWISIIQLRKEFTVDLAIMENHHLKTNGIYKRIRHPSYLGLLIICFGLSIAMNSIVSLLVVTIPVLFVVIYRVEIEENILIKEFGGIYEEYMGKTRKIIPKIY